MIGPITFFSSSSLFFSSLPYHLHDHQVRREDNWSNYIFLPGAWSSIALGKKKKTPNIWQGDKTWEKRVEDFYHVMLTCLAFLWLCLPKYFKLSRQNWQSSCKNLDYCPLLLQRFGFVLSLLSFLFDLASCISSHGFIHFSSSLFYCE